MPLPALGAIVPFLPAIGAGLQLGGAFFQGRAQQKEDKRFRRELEEFRRQQEQQQAFNNLISAASGGRVRNPFIGQGLDPPQPRQASSRVGSILGGLGTAAQLGGLTVQGIQAAKTAAATEALNRTLLGQKVEANRRTLSESAGTARAQAVPPLSQQLRQAPPGSSGIRPNKIPDLNLGLLGPAGGSGGVPQRLAPIAAAPKAAAPISGTDIFEQAGFNQERNRIAAERAAQIRTQQKNQLDLLSSLSKLSPSGTASVPTFDEKAASRQIKSLFGRNLALTSDEISTQLDTLFPTISDAQRSDLLSIASDFRATTRDQVAQSFETVTKRLRDGNISFGGAVSEFEASLRLRKIKLPKDDIDRVVEDFARAAGEVNLEPMVKREVADLLTLEQNISSVMDRLRDPEVAKQFGQAAGRLTEMRRSLGIGIEEFALSDDVRQTMTGLMLIKEDALRAKTGAAASEQERLFYDSLFGNPRQSASSIIQNLTEILGQTRRKRENLLQSRFGGQDFLLDNLNFLDSQLGL